MPGQTSIPVPGYADLHLSTRSGHVTVIGEERDDVLIEGGPRDEHIERDGAGGVRFMSANHGSSNVEVRCPTGSDVAAGTMSGHVRLRGHLGRVRVTTVSGNIEAEHVEAIDARTIAGGIEIERCDGKCALQTKSGRAQCGSAGKALASTISGQIRFDQAGSAKAQTVSGTVEVGLQGAGDVAVQTISGSVRVQVPKSVRPHTKLRSLSGRPRVECEPGNDCEIAVRSMSGRIEVVPA
jgi:DUF4097 and DUF4098 domain-containing protein YvlB